MPLVIVTGLPCSGKSTRARQLAEYLGNALPDRTVQVVSEEDHGAHRDDGYTDSNAEKKARGNFISAVERLVSRDTIVIADGMNYIKGYRYQLYCIARAVSTPHCVLHCVMREEDCIRRNQDRLDTGKPTYPTAVLEELFLRYEEPSNQARWDSPLFTVGTDDEVDWAEVASALSGSVARPPSMSTAVKGLSDGSLLVVLDKTTQEVVEQIMTRLRQVGVPTSVTIGTETIFIRRNVMASDLQRLRRQFIHMNRLHQVASDNISTLFCQYLQNNLKS